MWINIPIINWYIYQRCIAFLRFFYSTYLCITKLRHISTMFSLTHYSKYKGSQIYLRPIFSCRYVIFFFPPNSMRRFKARRCYKDRVLMPTICCLRQCVNLEELYLEKADSPAITTYLLAHILKFLTRNELITCFHEFWIYQSTNLLPEFFFNFF